MKDYVDVNDGGKEIIIKLSSDQMDEILIQAIKSIYENSVSYQWMHEEDIKISEKVSAACKVLLNYSMIRADAEAYFKSQEE